MNLPKLKFEKLSETATIPTRGTTQSAGLDLYLSEDINFYVKIDAMAKFGVAVEIPEGYVGILVVRSSLHKKGIQQNNSIGIIDSDYRGELMMPVRGYEPCRLETGERIAQLVIVPCFMGTPEEVVDLSETERGEGGFGSTGV